MTGLLPMSPECDETRPHVPVCCWVPYWVAGSSGVHASASGHMHSSHRKRACRLLPQTRQRWL